MSQTFSDFDFSNLNPDERLELIACLWDSLPEPPEIPDSHRQELKRRIARADADPDATIPWDDVKSRFKPKP
jgi:putative addiction module component (TIGR02574 family)